LFVFAATLTWADVIYLKDCSVIHGKIIETTPGVFYKIETRDGSIFVFKMEEIEKVVFSEKGFPKESGQKLKFSISPFMGSWEPKEIVDEREMFYGIDLSWITEKNVGFRFEYGHWGWEESGAEITCILSNLSCLYYNPLPIKPSINLFFGAGEGLYWLDSTVDDNVAPGFFSLLWSRTASCSSVLSRHRASSDCGKC
jgi:hypothetical protein